MFSLILFVGYVVTPNLSLSLSNVYHISNITLNLASIGRLCDSGNLVTFSSCYCFVKDLQSQKLIGTGHRKGGLYVLDELKVPATATATIAATIVDLSSFRLSPSSSSFYLWHSRFGHVSFSRLKFLAFIGALGQLQTHDVFYCSGCKLEKFSALPFNRSVSVSSSPFDLIHSDVWGAFSRSHKRRVLILCFFY